MGLLRLFLAISVMVGHLRFGRGLLGLTFLNGGWAIECFFIISGFYMALVLNEKYNYRGIYWTFIQQRVLRLYPLYLVILVLILGLEGLATYLGGRPFGLYETWAQQPRCVNLFSLAYYALTNLSMLGLDTLRFVQEDMLTGHLYLTPNTMTNANPGYEYIVNGPAWTLSVEMSFYLVAPFLVRRSVAVQLAWLLASFVLRWVFFLGMNPHVSINWLFYFSPSLLFFFMAGSLGYRWYRNYRSSLESFARSHVWIFWVFGLTMIDAGRLPLKDYFIYFFVPAWIVIVPLLFALTRHNARDRLIGELSYPFYLVHYQVVKTIETFLHENHNALFGPLALVITFGLAYLLYQVVELKTEHYREQLFKKKHSQEPAVFPSPG